MFRFLFDIFIRFGSSHVGSNSGVGRVETGGSVGTSIRLTKTMGGGGGKHVPPPLSPGPYGPNTSGPYPDQNPGRGAVHFYKHICDYFCSILFISENLRMATDTPPPHPPPRRIRLCT